METSQTDNRKWYQKKRFIIPSLLLGAALFSNLGSQDTNQTKGITEPSSQIQNVAPINTPNKEISPLEIIPAQSVQPTEQPQEIKKPTPQPTATPTSPKDVPLSNDNTYINSRGNEVHSPAYAPSVPQGASARCGDGSYSFSQSRRGTCSHHGGVSEWL